MSTLPCFACGKELKPAFRPPEGGEMPAWLDRNQPSAGTMFTSHGNYGSTVYDPSPSQAGREYIEINICDECLLARSEHVLLVRVTEPLPEHSEWHWDPDGLTWCEPCGRAVLKGDPESHEREHA